MHDNNSDAGKPVNYGEAILEGFTYLLENYPEVFVIGQGLWSPWYVGNTMTDLDKKFGVERIMDSPVSELACTGAAVGASLCGYRPIVVHPRMDFMLLATDPIVNQAAKWSHMLGGKAHPGLTIRSIINRGGEQGAQHSQALHSWYAHIPGLRVVMPATVADARDLLISSVLCDDPVLFIDDRWLYDREARLAPVKETALAQISDQLVHCGSDVTLVAAGFSVWQAERVATQLGEEGIGCDVVDLRVLNPMRTDALMKSVSKTRRLVAVDGGWRNCGLAGELIARVVEELGPDVLVSKPVRVTLPDTPAPTSKPLEKDYYLDDEELASVVRKVMSDQPAYA